jgi:hypothetical protein
MKTFHICCITNNIPQYEEMKQSYIDAGFDEERCRFTLLDNSVKNEYEPKGGLDKCLKETEEPYLIYCHQDILLNQGHGFDQLVRVLEELDELDPNWAIAGNAGRNSRGEIVLRITDPHNSPQWTGSLPEKVHSLDENFLVINSNKHVEVSPQMKGFFHQWGTDLCLNAVFQGYTCYVIDFHLEHLSKGKFRPEVLEAAIKAFQDSWNDKFIFSYVRNTYLDVFVSKYKILRLLFDNERARYRFVTTIDYLMEKLKFIKRETTPARKSGKMGSRLINNPDKQALPFPSIFSR